MCEELNHVLLVVKLVLIKFNVQFQIRACTYYASPIAWNSAKKPTKYRLQHFDLCNG